MLMPSIFGENLFDDWMDFPTDKDWEKGFFGKNNSLFGRRANQLMKTDVQENDNGYEVAVDLPGFGKDEIRLALENGYLTISAAKTLEKEDKGEKGRYIRKERYAGSLSRSFYVGENVREEEIHAKFENGILKLQIPKAAEKEVEQKNYIAIEG